MKFCERLKILRNKSNLSQAELAKYLKTSKSSINMYERGEREPGIDTLEAIADFFNVDMNYLLGKSDVPSRYSNIIPGILDFKKKKVPMLGSVACGEPIYSEGFGEYAITDEDVDCDFALRAQGDSMTGARIYDGDIVFVRQQETVDNGDIAVVLVGDEITLKRVQYHREKNRLVLYPENPAYEPLVYVDEELEEIRILGKAVAFQSML